MALLIFCFFISWTVASYLVISWTFLMIIDKFDITVRFHITPVDFCIIPRGFLNLYGGKWTPKTYPSAFSKIRCSHWWVRQVPPGYRDRGAVKLYENQCLAKMDLLLTLKSLNNFFGRNICCCLQKLKSLYV